MFKPAEFTVTPNATVHVRIVQKDTTPHTFTVSAEKDVELPLNLTPRELDAYFGNNNLTDVPIPGRVAADIVVWANFTAPAEEGRYEFVCRVPGHFQGGMLGFMNVERREVFVNLTMERITFQPNRFTVPPGAEVHVRIVQKDRVDHTFTVSSEKDVTLRQDLTSAQLDAYFMDNNLTDVVIPPSQGADVVVWANFTAPGTPGSYEFVCRIPGHFQSGMFGLMLVSEEPPPPDGGFRIGLISGIMLATIVFVLLFAVGYHVRAVRAHRRPK